ncbi:hypothetical protein BLOT_000515 [Blomia tropicalis]|nr:hypothetical protein BLOT_000515 [Blomia tropicalis]
MFVSCYQLANQSHASKYLLYVDFMGSYEILPQSCHIIHHDTYIIYVQELANNKIKLNANRVSYYM